MWIQLTDHEVQRGWCLSITVRENKWFFGSPVLEISFISGGGEVKYNFTKKNVKPAWGSQKQQVKLGVLFPGYVILLGIIPVIPSKEEVSCNPMATRPVRWEHIWVNFWGEIVCVCVWRRHRSRTYVPLVSKKHVYIIFIYKYIQRISVNVICKYINEHCSLFIDMNMISISIYRHIQIHIYTCVRIEHVHLYTAPQQSWFIDAVWWFSSYTRCIASYIHSHITTTCM